MNERLKILKLLEEGKINADEASRLLEALSHSESGHKKHHRMWAAFEHIPESIATMINGSLQHMSSPEELRFSGKSQLEIKAISGDLIIQGTEQNEILVRKDGFGHVKEKDDKIEIKAISGDINAQIPKQTKILIKGVSGAITISDMENEILLKTVSGNVIGKNLRGSFTGDMIAGDLVLDFIEVKDLNIRSRSGDVMLHLDDQIDAHISIETEEGEIFCDLPLQNEEKNDFTLKGDLKTGKGNIEIKCDLGDTHLKRRESKVTN
ncbi:hypothetical protein A2Y85_06005 [candidate division WOR-3 bacterium RBG_13_43_14]|uniref:Uncharacterized protein n=1 Tax=candidate division WOR-3 bacterium RBG_13_43_14 TaxID=1802590 RepID=A0A1F4U1Y5_UNCW3|nr:MAG: hypothetical protein A2Y85_06005 [candidate division WOR-3 bacterium RBG_13_43_14]